MGRRCDAESAVANSNEARWRHVEANEPPLHLRRNKLSVQFAVRVASHVSNPAREAIFNLKSKAQFDKNPTRVAPFGIHILHDLQQIGFNKQNLVLTRVPAKPPWLLQRPVINLDMLNTTHALMYYSRGLLKFENR